MPELKLNADRYPLYWPEHWPRTQPWRRSQSPYQLNFVRARDELVRELKLLRARDVVVSTNIPLRKDGLPLAGMSEPNDPGVAVYWTEHGSDGQLISRVVACDAWRTVRANLRAVGMAIAALRALKRTGATQVVEKAFGGFAALPPGRAARDWREVFCWTPGAIAGRQDIEARFKQLLLERHPDRGGSDDQVRELVEARECALREMGA